MCMHLHTCSDVHTHVCEHRSTHLRTRTHTHTYLHLARAEVSVSTPAAGEAQPAKERHVSASCVDAAAAGGRRRTRPLTSLPRGTASTADLTAPPGRRCSDTGPRTLGQAPSPHLPRTGSPPDEPPALPAAGVTRTPTGGGQPPAPRDPTPAPAAPLRRVRAHAASALGGPLARPRDVGGVSDRPRRARVPSECRLAHVQIRRPAQPSQARAPEPLLTGEA